MRRLFVILLLVMPLAISCRPIVNTGTTAVVKPLAGGEFNKFFPKDEGDYNVLYTQEKKEGFAQAKLNLKGVEVATLAVSDTTISVDARDKFKGSKEKIGGYPAAAVGELGTAILVADRFQVQVRSKDASFTAADRSAWLEKFDLAGLAALK